MNFHDKRVLGSTGLKAGRLGIASSFGAPAAAYEEAFARGCNYFTWGSFLRGRSTAMREAIRNITRQGQRQELILGMISYAHYAPLTRILLERGLRVLGTEYADVLILGYFPKRPPQKVIDGALELKEKGLVHHVGLTSHNRKLFPSLAREGIFDLFHLRYNIAHRSAETEIFPKLTQEERPGVVSFTATAWGKLLKQKKMPPGERAFQAADCYRFVLANEAVDVCMMGAKNREQMQENLTLLDKGPLSVEDLERFRRIGDYVHG